MEMCHSLHIFFPRNGLGDALRQHRRFQSDSVAPPEGVGVWHRRPWPSAELRPPVQLGHPDGGLAHRDAGQLLRPRKKVRGRNFHGFNKKSVVCLNISMTFNSLILRRLQSFIRALSDIKETNKMVHR